MKHRQFDQHVQKCKTMKYHGRQKGNINRLNGWYSRKRAGWGLGGAGTSAGLSSNHCSREGLLQSHQGGFFFLYV